MKQALTSCITPAKACRLYHAFEHAHDRGYPLTMHSTVIWSYLPDYPSGRSLLHQCEFVRYRTSLITKRLKDFHRYHKLPNYFVYVLENSEHRIRNFNRWVHIHLATHTPMYLHGKFMKVIRNAVFEGVDEGVRRSNTVVFSVHSNTWTLGHYLAKGSDPSAVLYEEPRTLLRDVLQGLAPDVARDPAQWDQGPIIGHRVGMSRCLDRAARAAWASTQDQDIEYRLAA